MKNLIKNFSALTAWGLAGASVRRATMTLLAVMFTTMTAWAGYGWYGCSMTIGGVTTNFAEWSTDGSNPTDLGIVTDMTITSIAFKVWSDANDRGGANMYFRIWDGGSAQVGNDQDQWLGAATRIAGDHDFAISWTGALDLANEVGLTLVPGKTYYVDMWAKTYGDAGDQWYSGGGANFHAKLTIPSVSYESGDCTATLNDGVLTISKTGSGTGAMANYGEASEQPWVEKRSDIKTIVIEDGVTSIGNYAFSNCEYATSVSIPASVTSIGNSSFFYCTGISSLTIAANSSLETIGSSAFYCAGIGPISIPASVTSIGSSAFDCCTNLTKVTLNSNPSIGRDSGTDAFPSTTTVEMNLTANSAGGAKWMTFYNENYSFEADANTQVFKAALSDKSLMLTELATDQIVNKNNAVILKSTASPIVMTLTTTGSNDFTGNSLKGVKDPAGVTADDPSTTYVLNYKDGTGVGFYKLTSGITVGVGKAYLTYNPQPGTGNTRDFFSFGETTGLKAIDNGQLTILSTTCRAAASASPRRVSIS